MIPTAPTGIPTRYLMPSALVVSREPLLVTTILGSCVSVCLWDSHLMTGGINHYMLPLWNGKGLESPKYGNVAIPLLISELLALGCSRDTLVAKIFGGGHVLNVEYNTFDISGRNVRVAMDILSAEKIPIVASSTGGNRGRKIMFNTVTGQVFHKLLENRNMNDK